jgi:hypothetical protein
VLFRLQLHSGLARCRLVLCSALPVVEFVSFIFQSHLLLPTTQPCPGCLSGCPQTPNLSRSPKIATLPPSPPLVLLLLHPISAALDRYIIRHRIVVWWIERLTAPLALPSPSHVHTYTIPPPLFWVCVCMGHCRRGLVTGSLALPITTPFLLDDLLQYRQNSNA